MGRIYLEFIDGSNVYICIKCDTHLSTFNELLSKGFQGRTGKAYLFNTIVNTNLGHPENQMLLTGVHTVCDIYCKGCQTTLGWKYIKAYEQEQKYKEGKFILEKSYLKKLNWAD